MFDYKILTSKINDNWKPFFNDTFEDLNIIFEELNKCEKTIYPLSSKIFRAFEYFSPQEIKLIILGQDPYINIENNKPQACGLSFSVPKCHKKIPPSLKNIYKEINNNYPETVIPKHGCLKCWAKEKKILLLNSALTVKAGESNSHQELWSKWSDKLITFINEINDKTIFLLMGNFAKNKIHLIDQNKHKIFTTVHPSPLSARNGFFGCNVFKLINEYLKEIKKEEIQWL
jgi:uracil-DNA glycosylase